MGARPGEAAPHAKLTATVVRIIREVYATGRVSMAALGVLFGVSKETVWKIVHRETWREEEDEDRVII